MPCQPVPDPTRMGQTRCRNSRCSMAHCLMERCLLEERHPPQVQRMAPLPSCFLPARFRSMCFPMAHWTLALRCRRLQPSKRRGLFRRRWSRCFQALHRRSQQFPARWKPASRICLCRLRSRWLHHYRPLLARLLQSRHPTPEAWRSRCRHRYCRPAFRVLRSRPVCPARCWSGWLRLKCRMLCLPAVCLRWTSGS